MREIHWIATVYEGFEVIIMDRRDNASDVPPSFEKLRARGVQSVKSPQPFNASVLKNLAAKHSLG